MAVDFAGFSKMVDALGGVEVCSTTPLEDYELGTVLANAGRQMVDGHTALQYVRARQVTTETNGDYGRIKRQQLFLSSLLRSMISKEVFFSLSKLNNVVNMFINDSYVDNIKTKDLVDLGQSIQGVARGPDHLRHRADHGIHRRVRQRARRAPRTCARCSTRSSTTTRCPRRRTPTTPRCPARPSRRPARRRSRRDAHAHRSTTASWSTRSPPTRRTSPCRCRTRPARTGWRPPRPANCRQHGFNVTTPDDYPGPLNSTTVFFSPGNEQAAATVASSFTNPTIERVTGMGDVVQVVLGTDFYSVAPPSPSGSPVQVHVVHGTSSTPTHLPEDLTVTNAADTTCE